MAILDRSTTTTSGAPNPYTQGVEQIRVPAADCSGGREERKGRGVRHELHDGHIDLTRWWTIPLIPGRPPMASKRAAPRSRWSTPRLTIRSTCSQKVETIVRKVITRNLITRIRNRACTSRKKLCQKHVIRSHDQKP